MGLLADVAFMLLGLALATDFRGVARTYATFYGKFMLKKEMAMVDFVMVRGFGGAIAIWVGIGLVRQLSS
jgi:hypothetical protein